MRHTRGRKSLAQELFELSRMQDIPNRFSKAARMAALILSGNWAPPVPEKRIMGYTCLGLVCGEWHEVQWAGDCWMYGHYVVNPERLAPMPVIREDA